MKIGIIYVSPNRTTHKINKELSKLFQNDKHDVIEIDLGKEKNRNFKNIDLSIFKDMDIIGLGSPIYHMNILKPLSKFLRTNLIKIKKLNPKIKTFLFITYGGITTGKALKNLAYLLKRNYIGVIGGLKVYAPHFWHTENYPYDETIKIINEFYLNLVKNDFRIQDWKKIEKLFSYQKPIVKVIYPLMGILKKIRGMPDIIYNNDNCIKCKKCAIECPVNAISMNDFPIRETDRCIHCYHCAITCPNDAIIADIDEIKERIESNKRIVGEETPVNVIYL